MWELQSSVATRLSFVFSALRSLWSWQAWTSRYSKSVIYQSVSQPICYFSVPLEHHSSRNTVAHKLRTDSKRSACICACALCLSFFMLVIVHVFSSGMLPDGVKQIFYAWIDGAGSDFDPCNFDCVWRKFCLCRNAWTFHCLNTPASYCAICTSVLLSCAVKPKRALPLETGIIIRRLALFEK